MELDKKDLDQMNVEELKQFYVDIGGSLDMSEYGAQSVRSFIKAQQSINKANEVLHPEDDSLFQSPLNEPLPEEEKTSFQQDLRSLRRAKEVNAPFDDLKAKNLVTERENRIRQRFGLEPKSFEYSESDIAVLLEMDNGKIGETCREFLDKQDAIHKNQYLEKMKELVSLSNLKKASIEKKIADRQKLLKEFQEITKVPDQIIFDSRSNAEANPEYETWRQNLPAFARRLEAQLRTAESLKKEFNEPVDQDLLNMDNQIKKLMEKHKI